MAKLKVQGNASGTGVVTLTAPNTNTDRTITLPDETVSLTGAPAGLDDVSGVARATSGLLFNGDTAAANALDDYETGTWTPQLGRWTGGAISATYTEQTGTYTKIGNMVTISFNITISAIASQGSSLAYILNKPFSISLDDQYNFTGIIGEEDTFGAGTDVGAIIPHNTYNAIIFRTAGAGGGNLVADWTTGSISGSVTYKV